MEVRLDKWLWAARFFRTRQKAIEAVKGGKVHVNGQRSKPSKTVFIQDQIELSFGSAQKIVVIKQISNERKGARSWPASYMKKRKKVLRPANELTSLGNLID